MLPLQGIKVIDLTIFQQGPVGASMLADMGAEVIKIEQRLSGDPGRSITRDLGLITGMGGPRDWFFEVFNRNKKSMTLDLKKEQGREILYKLVKRSDVFIQNFRKAVAKRLGIDYETLTRYNPKLIYASASGFGPKGPDVNKPSLDLLGLARAGLMEAAAAPGRPPQWISSGIADQMGGIMLAYGVVLALVARERLGIGQEVDSSHLGSMMWMQGHSIGAALILGYNPPRFDREHAGNPLHSYYQCKDGRWIALSLHIGDRYWPDFCKAVGIEELEKDPRFSGSEKRRRNCEELIAVLDRVFATRPLEEWVKALGSYPDLIFDVVQTYTDLPKDPQVIANDFVLEVEHPVYGPTKMLGPSCTAILGKTPGSVRRAAPALGEHTEEVLKEIGYTPQQIANLRDDQVI